MNIKELEPEFAQKLRDPLRDILQDLSYSFPEQYQIRVSLLDENGRKKRSDSSANNWSPLSGRIEIRFEPVRQEDAPLGIRVPPNAPAPKESNRYSNPMTDLLRALDRAESTPGWSFVPLKKFRDEILPSEHFSSRVNTDVEKAALLSSAIEKGLILTRKIPNPKSPQFPVTTIRLNRLMPDVKAALGQVEDSDSDLEFRPIEIRGEPLSQTVLRDRR